MPSVAAHELMHQIDELAAAELRSLRAESASALITAAPARSLFAGTPRALPYTNGRTLQVPLLLAPGAPSHLRVPTDLSINLIFVVAPNGDASLTGRPVLEDLVTAVSLALSCELRALEVASAALSAAHVALPPGAHSWAEALSVAVIDARVPRAQLVGDPTVHLVFDLQDPVRGRNSVVMDANSLAVLLVNGGKP